MLVASGRGCGIPGGSAGGLYHRVIDSGRGRQYPLDLMRYADDFIISGSSREPLVDEVKPLMASLIETRGLELLPEKTRISRPATCLYRHAAARPKRARHCGLSLVAYRLRVRRIGVRLAHYDIRPRGQTQGTALGYDYVDGAHRKSAARRCGASHRRTRGRTSRGPRAIADLLIQNNRNIRYHINAGIGRRVVVN